jgi:hypothetical protein
MRDLQHFPGIQQARVKYYCIFQLYNYYLGKLPTVKRLTDLPLSGLDTLKLYPKQIAPRRNIDIKAL